MSRVPGTYQNAPGELRRDRSQGGLVAEKMLLYAGALHAERWTIGKCTVMVAREPLNGQHRWHLSISHPSRYQTWDEIKAACYGVDVLQGVMLAQVMTPGDGSPWVNVSENCFHLYEIHDEAMVAS